MINDEKYYCVSELGAEILMVITSFIIVISVIFIISLWSVSHKINISTISDQGANLLLSLAYALFLPLMSYLFSQAKQYNSDGRAQVILIWMVLIEIIRMRSDPIFTWRLRKSAEQLVRLFWVGFLICSYAPLHGIRVSLLVLCIYFGVSEVLKGIIFKVAKDSYLIGKNPKIIHNYVERIMLQDDLHTTPMNICDYIVMGEQNHEIDVCSNGYVLGEKKSISVGILTIGRVFQLNSSEDEAFTSAFPGWRDICLSLALAKMLMRRFAKLPVDEAGCRKSLDFVLEGIIDYIGSNRDIQTNGNDRERNPTERVFSIIQNRERNPTKRVFSIIQNELLYVSDLLHMKVPTCYYFDRYEMFGPLSIFVMFGNGVYLIYTIHKKSSAWLSAVVEKAYNHCFFHVFRRGSMVVKIFSRLDLAITILLFIACVYIQNTSLVGLTSPRWSYLKIVERYIKDPTKWNRSHKPPSHLENSRKVPKAPRENVKKTRVHYSSIVDLEAVSILARLSKWIKRIIPRSSPSVICSTDAKEAILKSLRKNVGRLTNGETSLKSHGMDHLIWACQPHASTTETILIWHIATTLFHNHKPSPHQNIDPHQDPASQQNNNPFKEQEVALELSSYCHYLVKCLPDLLPDELDFTEKMYERVQKEILDIPLFFDQKPTTKYRCIYALQAMWVESSVVGKGARLAKDLMNCAEDEAQAVWMMLADFWAEMMLFIAPSDNVDGHEKLLDRDELITQLWALLTHAGIITRPKRTKHQDHQSESNAVTGDMNIIV
ncbi:hypothetical protein FCM35_KLT16561 [Carex littledalei]|uniref:DUF4220 domain-containing protein n=1 Tax=Carex littledalei TaxID=544730 RepID=A0A833VRR3_9POAL|nr:hypothetical protein FCM35_KLT16561 [Carex littledalei]